MTVPARKPAAAKRRLSIFIADDHVDTVLTLSAILRDEGHVVQTCADARQAVEQIRRFSPDVCILDLIMPGKSGFDIAREVRAAQPAPILIALSGRVSRSSGQAQADAAGFHYFLQKSSDSGELLALLEKLATADEPLPPAAA